METSSPFLGLQKVTKFTVMLARKNCGTNSCICRWFETPWRPCDVIVMLQTSHITQQTPLLYVLSERILQPLLNRFPLELWLIKKNVGSTSTWYRSVFFVPDRCLFDVRFDRSVLPPRMAHLILNKKTTTLINRRFAISRHGGYWRAMTVETRLTLNAAKPSAGMDL